MIFSAWGLSLEQYRSNRGRKSEQRATPWGEPRPLDLSSLPIFPTASMPPWLRAWIDAQAEALQVPSDLPALLALSVLSTACAKRYEVHVRKGWVEPLNLYAMIALASGTRKSVVFESATAPIVAFELERARRAKTTMRTADSEAEESRLRLVVDLERDKPRKRRASPKIALEPERRVFISDATPERVAALLAENGGRAAILSDEGEICSVIAGRYGGSFEVFLKAHSGQILTVERQGRSRVHIRRPALTLGLAVQPDVLSMLTAKKAVRERGLLARFIFAVPASNVGYRMVAPAPVPDEVIDSYARNICELLEEDDRLDDDGELASSPIRLTRAAHEAFTAFEADVEAMLRPERELGAIASWGSKLSGAVARIAALLALAERAAEVEDVTMQRAIAIGRYAIPHALAAFGNAGAKTELTDARLVLQWIVRANRQEISRREVHQALRARFPRAQDVDAPLRVLVEHEFLRELGQDERPGRPSMKYAVHPRMVGAADDQSP